MIRRRQRLGITDTNSPNAARSHETVMRYLLRSLLIHLFSLNTIVLLVGAVDNTATSTSSSSTMSSPAFSAETAFRKTVSTWQIQQRRQQQRRRRRKRKHGDGDDDSTNNNNDWDIWSEYAHTLLDIFDSTETSSSSNDDVKDTMRKANKLELIGGCEEGILFIEKQVFEHQQQHDNGDDDSYRRDAALSDLYTAYSQMLSNLSSMDCFRLASDPHTLLVGAPQALEDFHATMDKDEDGDEEEEEDEESISKRISRLFGTLCRTENADNALRNAIALDARNTRATELLQKLISSSSSSSSSQIEDKDGVHVRKPQEFVALLFDQAAETFDHKLLEDLQYRVPTMIGTTVQEQIILASSELSQQHPKQQHHVFKAVLDAGCGTGLVGRQIQHSLDVEDGILVGVDASSKMLDMARPCTRGGHGCGGGVEVDKDDDNDNNDNRPLYDVLLQMDLEDMTIANTLNETSSVASGFDLIVAADVLVYFGTLERILQVFSNLTTSTEHSYLVFTCERTTQGHAPLGFRLLPTGRFAHTKHHAVDMASRAGYELLYYQEIVPRMERNQPVQGHLFVFVKTTEVMAASTTTLGDGEL